MPYLSEILELFSSGEVHSLQGRFIHWGQAVDIYRASSTMQHLFGFGPGYFTVMDNSYLYILINYGIVGFITYIGLLVSIFMAISMQDNKIALRLLFVVLVAGTVLDLMISFLFMTFIYYLIGFKAELQSVQSPDSEKALSEVSRIAYQQ